MSINTNCHDTIVGLTQKNTSLDGYLVEYSESKSNLFVDELQGIILNANCDSTVWEMLLRARQNAWQNVRNDITALMQQYHEKVRYNKAIDIGNHVFLTVANVSTYAGVLFYSDVKGLTITIKTITITPYETGSFELKILNDDGELYTESVDLVARKAKIVTLATPITCSLYGNIAIVVTNNGHVYSQKLGCCGSTASYFDRDRPNYNRTDRKEWRRWIMATGITGTTTDIDSFTLRKGESLGIEVNAVFNCDDYDMFCSNNSDFIGDQIDRSIAFAMWYKTGEQFLSEMVSTGEVNRYVMLSFESIQSLVSYYNERYKVMIEYAAENMDTDRVECWTCRKKYNVTNRFGIR